MALRAKVGRAYGLRTVSELSIHYRSSPASEEGPAAPRRGPKAGDRLPDAPVSVDDRPTTLHRALAAPGYHLLLCGPARMWPKEDHTGPITSHLLCPYPAPGGLQDTSGLALHRLGFSAGRTGYLLIRPDGHIGYRAGGSDLSVLRGYLGRWGLTQSS